MKKLVWSLAVLALTMGVPTKSEATIVSVQTISGATAQQIDGSTTDACSSTGFFSSVHVICAEGGRQNMAQEGFDEQQRVLASAPVAMDSGLLAAGKIYNSHMIFFNGPTSDMGSSVAQWTFEHRIVGVMSDVNGTLVGASNSIFGLASIAYPGAGANTGMESTGPMVDNYTLIGPTTLEVDMYVTYPGDWIRVITMVPEPGTLLLLGTGLIGIVALARRRKS